MKKPYQQQTSYDLYTSNNVRHPVTKTFTTLHPTTLHFTTLVDTSLPLIYTLHPTTLHYPLILLYPI